jgi:hypothetical protein
VKAGLVAPINQNTAIPKYKPMTARKMCVRFVESIVMPKTASIVTWGNAP